MSTTDPRSKILERLQNHEKSRNWDVLAEGRWSAESGRQDVSANDSRQLPAREATTPQHLPRLKTPPGWPRDHQHDGDLRRGKQTVVPPVKSRRKTFVDQTNIQHSPQKTQARPSEPRHWQGNTGADSGFPLVPSLMYQQPHPQNGPTIIPNNAQHYPAGAYPVPMYMSYAPILLPAFQNPGGFSMGVVDSSRHPQRQLTRDDAARCIQKYYRGWRARKGSKYLQLQFLSKSRFAKRFVDDLISEFLQEEIIPDLLIQVISHTKTLSTQDPLYRLSSNICSDVLNEDLMTFLNQIAASVYYPRIQIESVSRSDPLARVCQELIDEVVREMAVAVVPLTIKSLVESHLTFSKSDDWFEDFVLETLQPMVRNVANSALEGYKYEAIGDEMIDEVTDSLVQPVIIEAWREVVGDHREAQIVEIGKYAEGRVLDSLFLEHLLGHLAGKNLSLYFRDYVEQTMDGLICGVLMQQYMSVHDDREDTLSNNLLKTYHQQLYTQTALDVILDELGAHLDQDMHDLLEEEKADAKAE